MTSPACTEPLISVVIPVFKSADKLPITLASLARQGDFAAWEAIVQDGSPDTKRGENVVSQFLAAYPQAKVKYVGAPDKGVYDAMNHGIDSSSGRFLYFAGAGDEVLDGIFDKITPHLNDAYKANQYTLVYGTWLRHDQNGPAGHEFTWLDFARKKNIIHQAMFFSRDIFNKLGKYDIRYPIRADNIMNMRIWADKSISRFYVPIPITQFEGGGLSDTKIDQAFYDDFDRVNAECFGFKGVVVAKLVELKLAMTVRK